jgi:predicted negative regulator of RcsB-dependent stress response
VPARLWQAGAGLLERHDVDGALGMYGELIDNHPADGAAQRALMRQGDLFRRQGDAASARRAYERARAHPACTPAAREAIERSLAQLGR